MTTRWDKLPNADSINTVLALLKSNPDSYVDSWNRIYPDGADSIWDYAVGQAMFSLRESDCGTSYWMEMATIAHDIPNKHISDTAMGVVSKTTLALLAYSDYTHLLYSNPKEVQILSKLGSAAAVLLYPACIALTESMADESIFHL